MDHQIKSTDDQTIESLVWAERLGRDSVRFEHLDGHEILVAPQGIKPTSLEEFADAPYRIKTHQKFTDIKSFATYVEGFKDSATKVFGSITGKAVTAVLDFHAPGYPSWGGHKAELVSMVSPEWQAFKNANEKWFPQQEFAEFLERWNHVIIEPEAAHISEIALNLEGSIDGKFAAKINRTNGAAKFTYEEEVNTNHLVMPTKFKIAVQPFYYSELVDVLVLLRFRVNEGKPKFQLVIQNAERIEYNALLDAFKKAETEVGQPVLVGP